jgi:hypothetical protein
MVWSTVLLSIGFVVFRYTRPKENWRDATAYVMSHAQHGDAVVVVPTWSEPVFDYYRSRAPRADVGEIAPSVLRDRESFISGASNYRRVWIVVYARDYALKEPDTRTVLDTVARSFHLVDGKDFRMLQVRLYVPVSGLETSK